MFTEDLEEMANTRYNTKTAGLILHMKRYTSCCVPKLSFWWVIMYLFFTALNGPTGMSEYTNVLLLKNREAISSKHT